MKYSTIRKEYQHHDLKSSVLVDYYATLISPFLTKLSLALGLIPNVVTVCMIASGIAGAALFALPFLWAKILGAVMIHLWYILDCSDGEVARITKRFSKFGTEIDYTAHAVNHPLFLLSFLWTMLGEDTGYSQLALCLMFFGLLALNMVSRIQIIFDDIYAARMKPADGENTPAPRPRNPVKAFISFFIKIALQLPNFILIFPVLYFINAHAAMWFFLGVLAVNLVMVPLRMLGWIRRIVSL